MKTIPQRAVIRACLRHVWVRGLEQRRAESLAIDLYPAVARLAPGLQAGELARRVADAASGGSPPAPCAKRQWTLTELVDPARLAEWLAYDGNPPTVMVETASSRLRHRYSAHRKEEKTVTDAETAALWYREFRDDLWAEWCKSPLNKRYTDTQFMRDCLKSIGITKGSIAECKARAKELRPDLYGDEDPALRGA